VTHGRVPLSVLALVVCAGVWVSGAVVAAQFALISIDEEIEIGQRADDELRKSVPELLDARTATYIRAVGRRLARAAPGPKYPYSFSVADYREVNAFALPGGPIWIHRGVIQAAASESQVAAVLAHEVAHLSNRHAADQLTKGIVANLGLGLLGAMLGNTGGAEATSVRPTGPACSCCGVQDGMGEG
jgi:predicted Zn-dependent protease